jgi:hypothetical protein
MDRFFANDENINKGFAIHFSIEEVDEKIKTGYLKT